jgi:hypothetical protein
MSFSVERSGMSETLSDDEKPLSPEAARFVGRVRLMMIIASVTTFVAVAMVLGVIGYRVFKSEGSAAPADMTLMVPKGARVLSTSVAEGRIAVTIEIGGAQEVRLFELKTLKPAGRVRFVTEP